MPVVRYSGATLNAMLHEQRYGTGRMTGEDYVIFSGSLWRAFFYARLD